MLALGFGASSAPSQTAAAEAEIQLVTAGPGTLTISPAEDAPSADCVVDAQQYQVPGCIHHYDPGTRVTLTATPNDGHSFVGWSDFKCAGKSTKCTLTLAAGTRFVTARFSPVTLRISEGEGNFGTITVSPKPAKPCTYDDGSPCEFPWGTTVTLRRAQSAPGYFWIGGCIGNTGGKLVPDADTCTIRLESNELIGAGYTEAGAIPPALGSGIVVVLGGSGRGKVTGRAINTPKTLNCGKRCTISGLTRNDYVKLSAVAAKGSRFYRWSDFSRQKTRVVEMASTNRIRATFVRK